MFSDHNLEREGMKIVSYMHIFEKIMKMRQVWDHLFIYNKERQSEIGRLKKSNSEIHRKKEYSFKTGV